MDVNREIDILFLSRIAKHRARMNTDNLIIIAAMRISILFRNISKSRAPFFQSFKKKKKKNIRSFVNERINHVFRG